MVCLNRKGLASATALALGLIVASPALLASSHREAPFITEMPKVDGTDFYMFRSYGPSAPADSVTLIANYLPLQDAYGGPNYFTLDPEALYEIHIDNDGDAVEDITFQFRFTTEYRNTSLPIGPEGADVTIPLANVGPGPSVADVGPGVNQNAGLNVIENYTVGVVRDGRRSAEPQMATNGSPVDNNNTNLFRKPVDNIGEKTISDYPTYAANHVFPISVPGCATQGRVFVGQRREGFVVNLGAVFDRVNLNPLPPRDDGQNIVDDKNITSLALELPTECLTNGSEDVIGGWTTASLRQGRLLNPVPQGPTSRVGNNSDPTGATVEGGAWTQVSRLGSPLVNEVVIGLDAKDRFNASSPVNDTAADVGFGTFVLYPTLPPLINALFGAVAPDRTQVPATPRNDLLAAFVTGVSGLNQPANAVPGEMLRLNTAIDPVAVGSQQDLGFLACDLTGFPNGRRPVDDVVDIALTVAMGAITANNPNNLQTCDVSQDPPAIQNNGAVVNDGALPSAGDYLTAFPYLNQPLPGAVNPPSAP